MSKIWDLIKIYGIPFTTNGRIWSIQEDIMIYFLIYLIYFTKIYFLLENGFRLSPIVRSLHCHLFCPKIDCNLCKGCQSPWNQFCEETRVTDLNFADDAVRVGDEADGLRELMSEKEWTRETKSNSMSLQKTRTVQELEKVGYYFVYCKAWW